MSYIYYFPCKTCAVINLHAPVMKRKVTPPLEKKEIFTTADIVSNSNRKGGNAGEHKWKSAVGIGEFIYCSFFLMFLQMNLKRIMIKWCRLVQSKKNQAKKNGWTKSKSSAPNALHGLLCFVSMKQWNYKLAFSPDKYSTLCYVLRLT